MEEEQTGSITRVNNEDVMKIRVTFQLLIFNFIIVKFEKYFGNIIDWVIKKLKFNNRIIFIGYFQINLNIKGFESLIKIR